MYQNPELFLHREECAGIGDGACHLQSIAHDAGVLQECRQFGVGKFRNRYRIEIGKCLAVIFALGEDGRPRQARLRAFENQELEQRVFIVNRHTPFLVMVIEIKITEA